MDQKQIPDLNTYEFQEFEFRELMQKRISQVLIVCSNYDFYMLEEDGRIDERLFEEYTSLNLREAPTFIHANSAKRAIKLMQTIKVDLVITWLDMGNRNTLETSKQIKETHPEVPIAALSYYSNELNQRLKKESKGIIDFAFHWNGNVGIVLAIIKLTEDMMNAEKDIGKIGVKAILLAEDSLKFYSRYIPMIYKVILRQTQRFVSEGLNQNQSMLMRRGRPKILLCTSYEDGLEKFNKYHKNLLGIISDVKYEKEGVVNERAGFDLLKYVRIIDRKIPFLMQSSERENEQHTLDLGGMFLYKHSNTLGVDIKQYIAKYYAFGDFEFWDPAQKKVTHVAKNLMQFQDALETATDASLQNHSAHNDFSKWLISRSLFPLAKLFWEVSYEDFENTQQIKQYLSEAIKKFRIYQSRGVIAKFNRRSYSKYMVFSRIGDGALGGKGRGLAFIDSFLNRRKLFNAFPGVKISIPRTVVLSTEVFDEFIEKHKLIHFVENTNSDEEILKGFVSKSLPDWVIEDLKAFVSITKTPVAVRSSSVLEDSRYQPFAGVFSTYMVPTAHDERMLEMICDAIKSVMASAFYQATKSYLKATSRTVEEDKMAVILQEVVGVQHEDVYYPNISGVASSMNFYPLGYEKPNEGIAKIALGLGEIVVEGGKTLRFSPYHPKKLLQLSSVGAAQRETQKHFYALDLDPEKFKPSLDQSINKKKISLRNAEKHRSLRFVASTYDLQNNVIRTGIMHEGIRVLTFDNVLKYNIFPLAEILQNLLRIGQREMRNPIEIEFAVKLDVPKGMPMEFSFLQIRPVVENHHVSNLLTEEVDEQDLIVYSTSALGNGKYEGIANFVYVKPETFSASNTREIALAIEKLNLLFEEKEEQYILSGPGRWGSSDPWLGIPVIWSQISSAKIIIESGLKDYRIDPSQGTHFFQNLTSFQVGYLTINPFINDGILDIDYLNQFPAAYEDEYLRHVRFDEPLNAYIDGKSNRAAIFKTGKNIQRHPESLEESINQTPPEGFT